IRLVHRTERLLHLLLGLWAVGGYVHLPEHRHALERPPARLEPSAVPGQCLTYEGTGVASTRNPGIADVGRAGNALHGVGSDPHRGARSLDRFGADGDIRELIEAAAERRRLL